MTATRRTFLKRTAALGAVLALPVAEAGAVDRQSSASKPVAAAEAHVDSGLSGGIADTVRNMVIDATFGVSPPAPRWVALVSELGDGAQPGVEVASQGCQRALVSFNAAENGTTSNATSAWLCASGRIAGFEMWTESVGGERLCWMPLDGGAVEFAEATLCQFRTGSIKYHWIN